MAVGLRALMPGQPDLEAGVTASTGLFYALKKAVSYQRSAISQTNFRLTA